ncbi:MAG: hypothetical protein HZA90_25315 [Verrucomicrobia bacterium]|nr:hypothetical protein [Verrucomicrobiota bacterium]
MKQLIAILTTALALAWPAFGGSTELERGFQQPPDSTKPWCYWYWISDNISKEGISRDLEAMARVGIGEALIGNIFLDDIPAGKTKVLTEEWWKLVEHAIREGGRTGVNIGMFNCPGWSQSGGPWIKPEQSMRYLVSSETRVRGPLKFERKLAQPKDQFQDVALLAFPAPQADADSVAARAPRVTCTPVAQGAESLIDGKSETALKFPTGAGAGKTPFTIELETAQPFTARSLALTPADSSWAAKCELHVADADGPFRSVKSFKFDRSNMAIGVGPLPRGPVTATFPAATGRRFRVLFTSVSGKAALAELNLSAAARVESFVEKQLGKMHPTPLPMWDTYLWPAQAELDSARLAVPPQSVVDLTAKLSPDGTLRWDAPAGDWIILRTGMTPTGTRNAPASPEGQGLEVDKMNRDLAKHHFDAFIGQVLKRMPASDRKAFKHVVADSYEMGSQNWTDGFAATFRQRYGYDPKPWLPTLTGRVVGSADQSDRFLWDLRRLVADHIATDYVGGLRDLCHPHGLQLWLENYGHWGFPAEFLQYGNQSDRIGGEFWVTGDLGSIECRAASSCANTYGKPIVSAEAFTGGPAFQTVPSTMKARGDWAFCEGINHFVLHVYIQQPWEDRKPGINAWFGTEFNRHNTWFESGQAWIDYLRRSCFLLQQGTRVADVAYFIGEDAPKMTGLRQPELPVGCDFDYINAEVILVKLSVKNGLLTLPHGTTYRVLVLPELATMRPAVLRKIRDLVNAGATIIGPPPSRSPSLENFPKRDEEVKKLAAEVWGEALTRPSGTLSRPTGEGRGEGAVARRFGKGRVITGQSLSAVLAELGTGLDFQSATKLRFTHRRDGATDIYFVANPQAQEITTVAAFRVTGKAPEWWWPDSGRIERPAVFEAADGTIRLPLHLGPQGSVFVVFRERTGAASPIVAVTRDGQPVIDTKWTAPRSSTASTGVTDIANNFTLAVWARPAADTTLVREANKGVSGMSEPRNDVIFPPHGNTFGDTGHAGSGLAVGCNGVVVFEHAGNYFAPVLVHPVALPDWTHLAVVYREGQPHLYVNGVLAHQGLKSTFTVHPGAGGGGSPFRGELGSLEQFPRALTDGEIAGLAKSMPRPGGVQAASAIQIVRSPDGGVEATVWQPGHYELRSADRKTRSLDATPGAKPLELAGPWEVNFTPGWGAPEKVTFEKLEDWAQHPSDGIKFYSGKATYRIAFDWKPAAGRPAADESVDASASRSRSLDPLNGSRRKEAHSSSGTANQSLLTSAATRPTEKGKAPVVLDLGKVRDLATVRLNGQTLGTLWLAPWRLDITSAVRAGSNVLEVEVVNPWNNRLVGDAKLAADKRLTFLATPSVRQNDPLMPAGLLGPVTIQAGERVKVR